MIWHIGNTTVRNPNRIREILIAYNDNGYLKDLFQKSNENEQAKLFRIAREAGCISTADNDIKQQAWYGRKLRLTLYELGLIANEKNLNYKPGEITKSGLALIDAKHQAEIENIFLRILFNLENRKRGQVNFRPVIFLLNIFKKLKEINQPQYITLNEYGLILQFYNINKTIEDYVNDIVSLRVESNQNIGNKKRFFDLKYSELARLSNRKIGTIRSDYPDVTFRYLKICGLFIEKGRGLRLNPQFDSLIETLIIKSNLETNIENYFTKLSNFPSIPLDEKRDLLVDVIKDNQLKIAAIDNNFAEPDLYSSNQELELFRIKQAQRLNDLNEIKFYHEQKDKTDVIIKWMERLENNSDLTFEDEYISFSNSERPQYFEWIIWRAFLSINCLISKPYESRMFKIDSSFKPIHHAPANKPDLIFEFDNFYLIVEVTLTTSDRQYAAEYQSVSRHVAKFTNQANKKTFCLFLAPRLDINIIKDYRVNDDYILNIDENDFSQKIDIVPLSLPSFKKFFKQIRKSDSKNPELIFNILKNCRANISLNNREWEDFINMNFTENLNRPLN